MVCGISCILNAWMPPIWRRAHYQETHMQKNSPFEGAGLIGLTEIFKTFEPCAYYLPELRLIIVATKDCSYTAEWISRWSEIHWQNYQPWYAPWKKGVGFSVYCPHDLGLSGDMPVTAVLDRVLREDPNACGRHRNLLYRLAKLLTVRISE